VAAQAENYLFILFWKEDNTATRMMRQTLDGAVAHQGERATWVAVQTSDAAEKSVVDQFGVSRARLPLVLAVAPNGAVTAGFPLKVTEAQLTQAFVSPGMARCPIPPIVEVHRKVLRASVTSTSHRPEHPLAAAVPRGLRFLFQ
jgi:hypothetical protein